MKTLENMTREQFMDLFGLTENDEAMGYADEAHELLDRSWYEIAKDQIATMNHLLGY